MQGEVRLSFITKKANIPYQNKRNILFNNNATLSLKKGV